ncbi:glycosyltransferase [Methylobacterium planeticum]|uniref:Glycosyltransferase family 1 protein n=1 Tax=Methylobacterium planeticum TaxID=2615211 RepID=A0A6N6ML05_9HYPH|nr:glycosyltransferase [Methylobacterium planeticum]KAB1070925.1 glycosyltransferase family 1 protein [Methylobacterium planeticum]
MKLLLAATPLTGHLNPLLAIARLAQARGDEVVVTTARAFADRVAAAGLRCVPYADDDAPEFRATDLPAGPERSRREFERRFLDPIPVQAAALRALIAAERPDVVVAGTLFLGVLPLLLSDAPRPPIVGYNVSFLFRDRADGAPLGPGLPPARDAAEAARYAAFGAAADAAFVNPVRAYADAILLRLDARPLPASLTQSILTLPDALIQPTVRAFEYPDGGLPERLRFVGALPLPAGETATPDWWPELDGGRRVVLVTQGTLANGDLGELLEPTLAALAHRDDLLVIATTGGRPVEAVRGPVPANARIARFLPFGALMPKVDLLVTNGGYGSVTLALAAGVPLVSAGVTEDKAEIGARIAWSGAGLNLAANAPGPEAIRTAAEAVLADPRFRTRARDLALDFARHDTPREILAVIDGAASTALAHPAAA